MLLTNGKSPRYHRPPEKSNGQDIPLRNKPRSPRPSHCHVGPTAQRPSRHLKPPLTNGPPPLAIRAPKAREVEELKREERERKREIAERGDRGERKRERERERRSRKPSRLLLLLLSRRPTPPPARGGGEL